MRSLRSVVAVMSTAFVMACQTFAGAGAATRPVTSVYSSNSPSTAGAPSAQPAAATIGTDYARQKNVAAASMSQSQKKTLLVVAIIAVVAIAAILIAGGSGTYAY
jgi:hypothetical protein